MMLTQVLAAVLALSVQVPADSGEVQQEYQPKDALERLVWAVHRDDFDKFKDAADDPRLDLKGHIYDLWVPLSFVAQNGSLEYLTYFLAKGIEVDERNADGSTALMRVVGSNFFGTHESPQAALLIEAGASLTARDKTGRTALHYAARLPWTDFGYQGEEKFQASVVGQLIDAGATVNARDGQGRTPLMHAVQGAWQLETINVLIERGADINAVDKLHRTCLTFVADRGRNDRIVEFLVDEGLSVGPVEHMLFGETEEALAMLLGGTEELAHGSRGESALAIAASTGNVRLVEAVLRYRVDPNTVDEIGETAIFAATGVSKWTSHSGMSGYDASPGAGDSRATIVKLIADAGGDPNAFIHADEKFFVRAEFETPLYRAAGAGLVSIVEALLKAGAKSQGAGEKTPLSAACAGKHHDVVMLLLESGADAKQGLPIRDLLGRSGGWPEGDAKTRPKTLRLLIDAGARLMFVERSEQVARYLGHEHAIHWALEDEDLECLKIILDEGVDVDLRGWSLRTPLISASMRGQAEVVAELLRRGAVRSLHDEEGKTALDYARENSHEEVVNQLDKTD